MLGVEGCVGQLPIPGRVSGAVNRFLLHMHFHFDGSGMFCCIAAVFPSLNSLNSFPLLHFLKGEFNNLSLGETRYTVSALHSDSKYRDGPDGTYIQNQLTGS